VTDETTFIRPGYRRTSGAPRAVDGIAFYPYSTGVNRYARITDDGQIMVKRNHNASTYSASVIGIGPIYDGNTTPKRFRTEGAAMESAVRLWRKVQEQKA
jgi:hypothetical protein